MPATTLDAALAYLRAGLSIVPIARDGSKRPIVRWSVFQERLPSEAEVWDWFNVNAPPGIAIVGGAVSGDLEQIDFDSQAETLLPAWSALVEEECPGLVIRLAIVRTPRQPCGYHVRYRCRDVPIPGNTDLAIDPAAASKDDRTLIQTRGEGGYALAPGSPGVCHETGREYTHHSGPKVSQVREISGEERECLIRCARYFDRRNTVAESAGLKPGEDFDRRGPDWSEILGPHGWRVTRTKGTERWWCRPGKDGTAWSATTGHCHGKDQTELLRVFSSNAAPFATDKAYGKFRAFSLLNHGGDWGAAARELAGRGFGDPERLAAHPAVPKPSANGTAAGQKPTVQQLISRQLGVVEACSHDDLLRMNLAEPSWVIHGLVADEGLTLLGGKKKLGKSWLCLQIAQAVATGTDCLGRAAVQGAVIYICLEDGRRRLKSRLIKQQTRLGLPITYYTRFPPLDGDGLGLLLDVLERDKPRLLILDTLAAAKTGKVDENSSGPMADLGNALRSLAQVYKAGVFATHHHGKLTGGDPGDDLRGSSALAAAGDVNLGLYREQAGHLLRGEGRDVSEFTLGLNFDPDVTWSWQVREDKRTALRDSADREVLDALASLGESDAEEVASFLDRSQRRIGERLRRLASEGLVSSRADRSGDNGRPRIIFSLPRNGTGEV